MIDHGLEKIAALTDEERAEIFRETAATGKITEAAIEKDFWVCWALSRLFADDELSKQILFKGGTSLSKCYGLIERFSEDIDLILDWDLLTDENPYEGRSKTQQQKFNEKMEESARTYIQATMFEQVKALMGDYCHFFINADEKPRSIMMTYPKSFDSPYIKSEIELEVGPMSGMTPNSQFIIKPYCEQIAQSVLGDLNLKVKAIEAKKTFWDKVTILHVEAHRPEDKNHPARYSRHYYDIYQMLKSDVLDEAMNDFDLLKDVIHFKDKFYPQGWANYQGAKEGCFKLIPEAFRVKSLKADYAQMEEMIFGEYPDFDEILKSVTDFEKRLNVEYDL